MSQSDRYSDRFEIAKRSQTIADTASDTEAEDRSRGRGQNSLKGWSPSIHNVTSVTRDVATALSVTPSPLAPSVEMDGQTIPLDFSQRLSTSGVTR